MRYVKLIFQRFRRKKILKIIHFGRNDWNGYLRSLHVKRCSAEKRIWFYAHWTAGCLASAIGSNTYGYTPEDVTP